jgi:hypothetical protein
MSVHLKRDLGKSFRTWSGASPILCISRLSLNGKEVVLSAKTIRKSIKMPFDIPIMVKLVQLLQSGNPLH